MIMRLGKGIHRDKDRSWRVELRKMDGYFIRSEKVCIEEFEREEC